MGVSQTPLLSEVDVYSSGRCWVHLWVCAQAIVSRNPPGSGWDMIACAVGAILLRGVPNHCHRLTPVSARTRYADFLVNTPMVS